MNVYQKIYEVMAAVGYLSKDGKAEYGKMKYRTLSARKVTEAVREKLLETGLVILPVRQESHREGQLTTVSVTYRIVNTEKPEEFVEVASQGEGFDSTDKGMGKALTNAYKYMLLRTFAIATGEQEVRREDPKRQCRPASERQKSEIKELCDANRVDLESWLFQRGYSWMELTEGQASSMLEKLTSSFG
ncbi:ERF family protein [Wansuia hejianensis]|uniref:ERF family protein n=1 Tax=Wansuia hejianensis TaxID=2763667 RepID=A0A7G9GB45_9FIRM|nr:ERF family protein [Wansuia hejianensis]QNM08027.1 ERF family protein [Wansuia hejianensis]RHV86995.1 hypothetical protein DXA96_14510 [Lachnospiraceae bacterium OF09-33XD]